TVERYEPGLIVFDYLQQAAVNAKLERRLALEEFTRGLKVLAMKAQIPILVAAQLNRSSEHRPDGKPILADLRETGAIEQDADTVILMHRPELTQPETPRAGEADLIVAKQRNGPTGTISLGAQLHYARLVDMAH
ncbi:MAG TPA: DnaB-like helicase C-terminal domain-containing protein, partial [Beutenbergiaceae bacterium]|nr:DnaB-like helicase C-terminal domain-containing protein [Beutenbergiaceae bacterium]HLS01326.1 DnaB-like helicase C-terminal domain-containing protein [Beutenbergiaceae bacterium]